MIHVLETNISNFVFRENLMAEVRLGILYEHVQHLFAICQQISLHSVFREKCRITARNPLLSERTHTDIFLILAFYNSKLSFLNSKFDTVKRIPLYW